MKHLQENNETYCSHFMFASGIAIHLSLSSVFLMIHAIAPWWQQPDAYNLESTCKLLKNRGKKDE